MKDYHSQLFPYAYNILGSVEDAKDAVQDVLVKYLSIKSEIENVTGYLIRGVINQSINLKKKRNKIRVDQLWLPEPYATEKTDKNIDRDTIISYSILVLLEKLTPLERGVFILNQAFDYPHKDIAKILDITQEYSRKLLSRAKSRLSDSNTVVNVKQDTLNFMERYIDIIKNGKTEELEKMLAEDISLTADGGGKIKVVKERTAGKKETLELLFYVYQKYQKALDVKISEVNHQPVLVFYHKNKVAHCQVFEVENEKIKNIFAVLVPAKLNAVI